MKQADTRNMFEKWLQECLYVNHFGISWPLVPYSINVFSYENTEENYDDPELADEGDIQMEYFPD